MDNDVQLRKTIRHREGIDEQVRYKDLRIGDVFSVYESDGTYVGTYEATENPVPDPGRTDLMMVMVKDFSPQMSFTF